MLALLTDPQAWLSLVILTALEIVLGIDNVIFIALLVDRLPPRRQERARVVGLSLAMLTRIVLLYSIVWITRRTQPEFTIAGVPLSARDLILLAGGLFLLVKSVTEIHHTLEHSRAQRSARRYARFGFIVLQIALIDIVLSLDSVFTAVGLANQLAIMVTAIIFAIAVMMWVAGTVAAFIERYPTIKILALAFLILIGSALLASGLHFEIPKGYLYFAMGFAVAVEMTNIRLRRHLAARRRPRGS
ncbi:MAG TPA: TerC family protein [Steroidobacteraceae bacterium]|jgi:predicted tellurium resistance membrane protein TerC|nr:TerC family protein [Steroidobacteraceae bacterium]